MALLEIRNLSVEYKRFKKTITAVRNVSLEIGQGEIFGLVGESGCGKTTLALTIGKLIPREPAAKINSGSIIFEGNNLLDMDEEKIRDICGRDVGFIFQDPLSALNPVLRIGEQVGEVLETHLGLSSAKSKDMCLDLFGKVRLADPVRTYSSYPHQLSGGERQRVMIAMAIAAKPKLLIADEPTTALDVTIQSKILDLLVYLSGEMAMSILLVTHNMGVVSRVAGRLAVMYAGQIIELGKTTDVLQSPLHPYTEALLNSLPRIKTRVGETGRLSAIPGQPPDLADIPGGCPFHPRCHKYLGDICKQAEPRLTEKENRYVSCHIYGHS